MEGEEMALEQRVGGAVVLLLLQIDGVLSMCTISFSLISVKFFWLV